MNLKGLKKIGQGAFSKVYALNDKKVLIDTVCSAKLCLEDSYIEVKGVFPVLKRVWSNEVDNLFSCKRYEKVLAPKQVLKPEYYEVYKELRELQNTISYVNKTNYDVLETAFNTIKNRKYKKALLDMLVSLSGWGYDMRFEISPRNIAVNKGRLILLDVFYFHNELMEVRKEKKIK